MKLPDLRDFDLKEKRVLLRVDLDIPLKKIDNSDGSFEYQIVDESRLEDFIPTLKYLLEKGARSVGILGHIGRYEGEGKGISTFGLWSVISKLAGEATSFWPGISGDLTSEGIRIHLFENLRMYKGEEKNDPEFVQKLASSGDFYVNEAFATSHREHASIVGLPKLLPHAAGLRLIEEINNLSRVFENPQKPVVVVLGGAKEDKLDYIKYLKRFADEILIGGRLPEFIDKDQKGIVVAELTADNEDINEQSIKLFEETIGNAGTVVLAGPMGKFEDNIHKQGTEKIYRTIANSKAYKIAGGGDTESAITKLNLNNKFDWISVGGGAMLEYLAKGDLPGLKALRE